MSKNLGIQAKDLSVVINGKNKILSEDKVNFVKLGKDSKLKISKKITKAEDLVAIKNGENLEIYYSDGSSIVLEGFYALENVSLELPTNENESHLLSSVLEESSETSIIYAQGDMSKFSSLFENNESLLNALSDYNHSLSGMNAGDNVAAGAEAANTGLGGISTTTLVVGGLVVGGIAIAAASGGGSGGGSSSKSTTESTTENGYLADSPIIGARYERYDANGKLVASGTTGTGGLFVYKPGETIVFKIGNVVLGSIDASEMPKDGYVMPQDIIGVSRDLNGATAEQIAKVTQMAIFLQTLDAVGNANDGTIVINSDSLDLIDPNAPSWSFEDGLTAVDALNGQALTDAGKTAVTALDALQHLTTTAENINHAPVVTGDANLGSFVEDNSSTLTTTGNVSDLIKNIVSDKEGDTLTIKDGVYQGTYGTLVIVDGVYTYTLNPSQQSVPDGQTLDDTFEVEVRDGTHSVPLNITASVTGVNSTPVAGNDVTDGVLENGVLNIVFNSLLTNDSVEGLSRLTAPITSNNGATITVENSGTIDNSAEIIFVIDDSGSMGGYQQTLLNNLDSLALSLSESGKTDVKFGLVWYGDDGSNQKSIQFNGTDLWTTDIAVLKNAILANFSENGWGTENALGAVQLTLNEFALSSTSSSKNIVLVTDENADDYVDGMGLYANTLTNVQNAGFTVHSIYDTEDSEGILDLATDTNGIAIDISTDWGATLGASLSEAVSQKIIYEANGATIEALGDGQTLDDTFTYTITDADGQTSTATVTVKVTGVNDAAIIDANSTSVVTEVTEDGSLTVSGLATHTDVDNNNADNKFKQVEDITTTYGKYTVSETGNWTYTLDNTNTVVQDLSSTQTLEDTIVITAEDGTTKELTITINGKNEVLSPVGITITNDNLLDDFINYTESTEANTFRVNLTGSEAVEGDVVKLYSNDVLVAQAVLNEMAILLNRVDFTIAANTFTDGEKSFAATLSKNSVESDYSTPLTFVVDKIAPVTPVVVSDTENVNTLIITAEAGTTLVIKDENGNDITGKFNITDNEDNTFTAIANENQFNATPGTLTVVSTDEAGNSSLASSSFNTNVLDTTAPVAPVITAVADVDNNSFDQGFTVTEGSDVVVTVNGTELDAIALAAAFTKTTNGGLDTYTANVDSFVGTETILVDATITDTAGNTSDSATQVTLQNVDTTAPETTVTIDSGEKLTTNKSTITVTATLSGALASGEIVQYSIDNGNTWTQTTPTGTAISISISNVDATNVSQIQIQVVDEAGNAGNTASQNITYDNVAPSAPSLSEDGNNLSDTIFQADENITVVRVTLNETDAVVGDTVELFENGSSFTVPKTIELQSNDISNGYADFGVLATDLTQGAYSITATITDVAGNESNASTAIKFAYDAQTDDTINYSQSEGINTYSGTDTLFLDTVISNSLDVSTLDVSNIEKIDLSNGDYALTNITADDVLSMTDGNNVLNILNQTGDSVDLRGWTQDTTNTTTYTATATATGGATVSIIVDTNDGVITA